MMPVIMTTRMRWHKGHHWLEALSRQADSTASGSTQCTPSHSHHYSLLVHEPLAPLARDNDYEITRVPNNNFKRVAVRLGPRGRLGLR